MSNRRPRGPISGLFPQTSIAVTEHPDLPGLNLCVLHLGQCDTRIPPEKARAEFSRLVAMIHDRQEEDERRWLEGMIWHLSIPLDRRRRAKILAGMKMHVERIDGLTAPDPYDVKIREVFRTAIRWMGAPLRQRSHSDILMALARIYGPAFPERYSPDQVRRAYTTVRKQQAKLIAERDRLRKLPPQSAQL